jgi:colicin import membrane protein
MHENEPDGINEALAGTLRVGLTLAGQLAERAARAREQAARQVQAASEQEARELRSRLDAERAAARTGLAPVFRDEWWQHAEPDDIARAWQTAQTWRELDPEAHRAADRIRSQVLERYGVDTRDLAADPAAVRDALLREAAWPGRGRAPAEAAEASALLMSADRADAAQIAVAGPNDHIDVDVHVTAPANREQLADALEGIADVEVVEARVVAATNQGRPAAEAVNSSPQRAPRARRAPATGPMRDRGRSR